MRIGRGNVLHEARLRLLDLRFQIARAAAELLRLLVRNAVRATFDWVGRFDLVKILFPLGRFDEFDH
ncbi:hypothetical protein WK41_14820 [Burkholderia cepacia]|nr:hypothetical protein WK41_14820 [Burkholderia cepacia]